MSRKRKIILILLVAVTLAAVLAALLWPKPPAAPPQIINLPNGAVCEFAGTTYGTNHLFGTFAARTIYHLPRPVYLFTHKILGTNFPVAQRGRDTPQPCLVAWFKITSPSTPTGALSPTGRLILPAGPATWIQAVLADEDGVESGAQASVMYPGGVILGRGLEFPVQPRRSRTLQIRFYEMDYRNRVLGQIGTVKFPNPVFGKFPQWQPDAGPSVRKSGDLEVRLDNFFIGRHTGRSIFLTNGQPAYGYDPAQKGERAETVFDVTLVSPAGVNSPWLLQNAVLSDATGNALDNSLISFRWDWDSDGISTGLSPMVGLGSTRRSLTGALWPDESAWKLRLDFRHTTGFNTNDLVTFRQVPVPAVGATNLPGLRHRIGDTQVVLAEFSRSPVPTDDELEAFKTGRGPMPGNRMAPTILRFEITGRRDGLAVDFVRLTTATPGSRDEAPAKSDDEPRLAYNQWQPGVRVIGLSALSTNAKTVDITFAVQKTRSVEFLLKPPAVVSQ